MPGIWSVRQARSRYQGFWETKTFWQGKKMLFSSIPNCLATPHPFTLTSGFVAGINTLSFRVENYSGATGNPTGIIVSVSGTAEHAPEPAAAGLLGSGLLGLWLLRRRIVQV